MFKDLGLVSQVFDEQVLSSLHGHIAVGHCRYSTTGSTTWENAQPTFDHHRSVPGIALGHNGNLVNTVELARKVLAGRASGGSTELHHRLRHHHQAAGRGRPDAGLQAAAMELLPTLRGAFCLVFCDEQTLYAARDPQGVRPLVLGRLDRGWVVASETAALDIVGASFVREVEPGELLAIDADGLRSERFAPADAQGLPVRVRLPGPAGHHPSPDAVCTPPGSRSAAGWPLEAPVEADLVIPTPESGTPSAIGYAQASGIPYGQGLVKNAYVGRTFIQPSQTIRQLGIRLKLNPLRDVIRGKRLVVVDDSIVRGNTQRALVRMLREAGALEVHVRIASPPVRWPCFYGIDFASRAELIANAGDVDAVRRSIGADTLGYVSLDALVAASEQPKNRLCTRLFHRRLPDRDPGSGRQARARGHRPRGGRRRRSGGHRQLRRRGRAESAVTDLTHPIGSGATYAGSGVSIAAGEAAVDLMKPYTEKTRRPEVLGGIGGFASLFRLPMHRYRDPVLASSSDGVGTKSAIAQAMDVHTTIGIDLVAMVVDDLVACGAEPLFLQDYIACGKLDPETHRGHRQRHRRGLCPGRLCAGRRRDRRAPGADGAGGLRPGLHRRRHRRGATRSSVPTGSGPVTW